MFWRWAVMYPLYTLSEVAIIATDMAELLGSAIALCMLFPSLPIWVGVLLTGADVIFVLALGDPLRGEFCYSSFSRDVLTLRQVDLLDSLNGLSWHWYVAHAHLLFAR